MTFAIVNQQKNTFYNSTSLGSKSVRNILTCIMQTACHILLYIIFACKYVTVCINDMTMGVKHKLTVHTYCICVVGISFEKVTSKLNQKCACQLVVRQKNWTGQIEPLKKNQRKTHLSFQRISIVLLPEIVIS